tara:strand:- start:676 stop:1191 length:516 start_codon:yes stop_codon:yes gene_type:complete
MAQIIDKGNLVKIIKDNGDISLHEKVVDSIYLEVKVVNGSFQILRSENILEDLGSYKLFSSPSATSFNSLVDSVVTIIYNGSSNIFWTQASGVIYPTEITDQIAVGTTVGDSSAAIEVVSTTQGILPSRMTTAQMNLITTPAKGLMIYDITTNQWKGNTGTPGAPTWTVIG